MQVDWSASVEQSVIRVIQWTMKKLLVLTLSQRSVTPPTLRSDILCSANAVGILLDDIGECEKESLSAWRRDDMMGKNDLVQKLVTNCNRSVKAATARAIKTEIDNT